MPKRSKLKGDCLFRVGAYEILLNLRERGPLSYSELLSLEPSVYRSTTTLATRLKELIDIGLVKRRVNVPPSGRVGISYIITEYGLEALKLVEGIEKVLQEARYEKIQKEIKNLSQDLNP